VALTADERALVRSEIGDAEPPTTTELDEIHERRGGLVGVVREVWSKRLADLLAEPASFSVAGQYSESSGDNIRAIQERLRALSGSADDSDVIPPMGVPAMRVYRLVRSTSGR
jgi:hypothetical protein